VVTCAHVVGDQRKVIVKSGLGTMEGTVLAVDKVQDIAVLSVPIKHVPLKVHKSSQMLPRNSFVIAAGMGDEVMDMDMRPGQVIAHFRAPYYNYIMSCPPKAGYSGGPVLDSNGYLVGIMRGLAHLEDKVYMDVVPSHKIFRLVEKRLNELLP